MKIIKRTPQEIKLESEFKEECFRHQITLSKLVEKANAAIEALEKESEKTGIPVQLGKQVYFPESCPDKFPDLLRWKAQWIAGVPIFCQDEDELGKWLTSVGTC